MAIKNSRFQSRCEKKIKISKCRRNTYLIVILTFLLAFLQCLLPLKVTLAVYLPFFLRFLILNVAFPLALVFALQVLPLTFKVSFTFFIAFPTLFLSVTVYFLTFLDFIGEESVEKDIVTSMSQNMLLLDTQMTLLYYVRHQKMLIMYTFSQKII